MPKLIFPFLFLFSAEYVTDPFAFVTLDESFFWMLRSDTRPIGRVLDVVWYDLSVTKAKGRLHTHSPLNSNHQPY